MKIYKFIICLVVMSFTLTLPACKSDSNFDVDAAIEAGLYQKYPNATTLEWKEDGSFLVAEFRNEGYYHKAWFDKTGKWWMTEINELIYKTLSDYIRVNFEGKYSISDIRSIRKVQFSDIESRYIIEVAGSKPHAFLFYRKSGDLFKEINSAWENYPIIIPQTIVNYIETDFEEDIKIIDANVASTPIRILIYETKFKTLLFDASNKQIASYWKITRKEIANDDVEKTISTMLAANDILNEVYRIQFEDKSGFIYCFKINGGAKKIFIDEDGIDITNTIGIEF